MRIELNWVILLLVYLIWTKCQWIVDKVFHHDVKSMADFQVNSIDDYRTILHVFEQHFADPRLLRPDGTCNTEIAAYFNSGLPSVPPECKKYGK